MDKVRVTLNRKLTPIIAGRSIKEATQRDGALNVTFGDGSNMRIKVGALAPTQQLAGRTVKSVRQGGTEMDLDMQDGTSVAISLAEETSSVMLRDAGGELEYAD